MVYFYYSRRLLFRSVDIIQSFDNADRQFCHRLLPHTTCTPIQASSCFRVSQPLPQAFALQGSGVHLGVLFTVFVSCICLLPDMTFPFSQFGSEPLLSKGMKVQPPDTAFLCSNSQTLCAGMVSFPWQPTDNLFTVFIFVSADFYVNIYVPISLADSQTATCILRNLT